MYFSCAAEEQWDRQVHLVLITLTLTFKELDQNFQLPATKLLRFF